MINDSSEVLFTKRERYIAFFGIAFFVLVVGYFSLLWQYSIEQDTVKKQAEAYVEDIYNKVTEITGVATSLRALYRVTSESGTDELEQFTEDLSQWSGSIVSIGRFDHIMSNDIDAFASLMAERGIYRFELKSLELDGSVSPVPAQDYYDAIVSISPFNPRAARLIGVDLSQSGTLAAAIDSAVRADRGVLAEYPAGWPQAADSLFFIPTYAGRYTPETANSRAVQNDGGYYVELSLAELIKDVDNFSIEIRLPGKTLSNSFADAVLHNRYFKGLFSGHRTEINPSIGSTEVGITLHSASGVCLNKIVYALLWMLGSLALALIGLVFVTRTRRSDLQRKLTQKSLEQERQIALTTLEAINDSVFTLSSDGGISYVNPAGEAMVELGSEQLLGMNVKAALPISGPHSDTNALVEIESKLLEGKPAELKEVSLMTENATQVECAFTPFTSEDATDSRGGVLIMRDVGKERALNRKLEHLATHDSLTGLYNRYYFELRLEEMVEGAKAHDETHAVCYIDMDQFKVVNDTCGHQAGDRLLVQLGDHLKAICRSDDILARIGGDEFGLLIKNCDERESEEIARRLHDSLQSFYFASDGHKFAVRACFGFVAINRSYDHISDVLAAADIACYSAKDKGRNDIHFFRAECEETSQRQGEMNMLPKLQNALSVDRFVLFVQPIAEILPDGVNAYSKYEILLRMQEDDGSLITPFQLISAAERYDLMKQVDRWVLNRAFREIAELCEIYGEENTPVFSINLSGQSVMDSELVGFILHKVRETGVLPSKICFEITETSAMSNINQALALVEFLHYLGSTVALDDFGAGECSFGYLKTLPVDYLKVDGQFVKDVDTCNVHKEMLMFVQRVAKILNMKTVAEFVENESILNSLRELDINYAQGYHISKPFDISELKKLGAIDKAA